MNELRREWACVDGCGLRVRNADGRSIPEPAKWSEGRCLSCRVRAERIANGLEAAKALEDRLLGRRPKRPGPFSHHNDDDEAEPKKRQPKPGPTDEERERIAAELRSTFDTDAAIARRVGLPTKAVQQERERLSLPIAPVRRSRARQRKLEAFLMADPDRLKWSAEEIAEVIGEDASKIRTDRVHLGLGIGRGNGQRKPPTTTRSEERRRARLARVRAFVAEHPNATNAQVADALGLQERRVQKDRHALGMGRPQGKHGVSEMAKSAT